MKGTKPYPFQMEGIRSITRFGGRALLADDMGLGKTLQVLKWLHNRPALRLPALVVCPASLKHVWEREATVHVGLRSVVLSGRRQVAPGRWRTVDNCLTIVNYDVLPAWIPYVRSLGIRTLVIDECHYVSNRKTQRYKATRAVAKSVPYLIAVSGSPLVNRPAELWPVLNLLMPEDYPSFFPFAVEFCAPKKTRWGWDFNGAANLPELHRRLRDQCMIRRRTEEVLTELPKKSRIVIPLELPADAQRKYRNEETDYVSWASAHTEAMAQKLGASRARQLERLGRLKRGVGELKLPLVLKWIDDFLAESTEKLIVFGVHRKIVAAIEGRYGKAAVKIDGGTPVPKRRLAVDRFQRDKTCRVFVGNIVAAGVGLTLTAATAVVFAELDWVPGNHTQAEKRAHRIGQSYPVRIYYLVARGTVEERLLSVIQSKQRTISGVLDGDGRGDDLSVYDQLTRELVRGSK